MFTPCCVTDLRSPPCTRMYVVRSPSRPFRVFYSNSPFTGYTLSTSTWSSPVFNIREIYSLGYGHGTEPGPRFRSEGVAKLRKRSENTLAWLPKIKRVDLALESYDNASRVGFHVQGIIDRLVRIMSPLRAVTELIPHRGMHKLTTFPTAAGTIIHATTSMGTAFLPTIWEAFCAALVMTFS